MALFAIGRPINVTSSGAFRGAQSGYIVGVLIRGGSAAAADVRIRDGQLIGDTVIIPQIVAAQDITEGFVGFPVPFSNGFFVELDSFPAGAECTVYVG